MKDKDISDEMARLRQRVSELETLESEYSLLKEKLNHAYHDKLTGLPNRLLFYENLTYALIQAERNKHAAAVMFISIDRFKLINDTLGHVIGDLLLKSMAERLKVCMRKSDYLARPGRNEFMILLSEINKEIDARIIAERIFDSVNSPFILDNNELLVTIRIGISLYPFDCSEAGTLIRNAYTAMSSTKEHSSNNYRFYSPDMNAAAFECLLIENDLRLALRRSEFILHYQPQIDLRTGRIIGMEALLRWQRPGLGLIKPGGFISAVEKTELVESLGEWVIQAACEQNRAWQKAGLPPVRVAVNLSSRQFHQKNLIETVAQILKDNSLDPKWLEFEMTESAIMHNDKSTVYTLRALRDMGINLSIDDFGTGFSSLNYLRFLPVNRLKIDQSFVRSAPTDEADAAISKAIITIAHSLKLEVTAEGIETIEQLEFFRALNCDEAQGYLFYKPLPADEIASCYLDQ